MATDFNKLIKEAKEFSEKWTVIEGYCDVINNNNIPHVKSLDESAYWVVAGKYEIHKMIEEAFIDLYFEDDFRPGGYFFQAVLSYESFEYDHGFRSGGLYIEHINWTLEETFEQRERDKKLTFLLDDGSSYLSVEYFEKYLSSCVFTNNLRKDNRKSKIISIFEHGNR